MRSGADDGMGHSFEVVCNWLDNNSELNLYTIAHVHAKMMELAGAQLENTEAKAAFILRRTRVLR